MLPHHLVEETCFPHATSDFCILTPDYFLPNGYKTFQRKPNFSANRMSVYVATADTTLAMHPDRNRD